MSEPTDILDALPPPDAIRSMIAERLREAAVLRGLLRVAEKRERADQRQQAKRQRGSKACGAGETG